MQAYAEGFGLFEASEFELDNAKIAHLWMRGSVVRSWLCELAANAFEQEGNDLAALEPVVAESGEGRWTVEDAVEKRIPLPVITAALFTRYETAEPRRLRGEGQRRAARAVRRPRGAAPSRRLKDHGDRRQAGRDARQPARRGARAAAGPPHHAGDLRRDGRPGPAQAAAGDLQPRPRGRAAGALQPRRQLAQRDGPRGVQRARRRGHPPVQPPRARRDGAQGAALQRPLRQRHVRRGLGLRGADRASRCL